MPDTHELLRLLTSPITAITSKRGDEVNGMIANSAARASISVDAPRLSVYIHKFNHSHDMVFQSGLFVLHVLGEEDIDTVYRLGFASRRDGPKIEGLEHTTGELGLPVLRNCFCYFECEVVNVMDTGASTLFFAAVRHTVRGNRQRVLTPIHLRNVMPEDRMRMYLDNMKVAQQYATEHADDMRAVIWRGLRR